MADVTLNGGFKKKVNWMRLVEMAGVILPLIIGLFFFIDRISAVELNITKIETKVEAMGRTLQELVDIHPRREVLSGGKP